MKYDVAVIGSGPAGIQAAIHSSRKKVKTVILGKISSSATYGTTIENYFGIADAEGNVLLETGMKQALSFGCSQLPYHVVSANRSNDMFVLEIEDGTVIEASAVVLATGISRKKLNVPGEKELFGKGVSYCASCDCNFYKQKIVAIIGDESEAAASASLMTKYASKTYWISNNMQVADRMMNKAVADGVEIVKKKVNSILGDGKVESVTFNDGTSIKVDGVFIELGAKSSADIAMDLDVMPEIDDSISVSKDCSTQVPGVFACGDATGKPWQLAKAVGQGCVAGISSADYVIRRNK